MSYFLPSFISYWKLRFRVSFSEAATKGSTGAAEMNRMRFTVRVFLLSACVFAESSAESSKLSNSFRIVFAHYSDRSHFLVARKLFFVRGTMIGRILCGLRFIGSCRGPRLQTIERGLLTRFIPILLTSAQ